MIGADATLAKAYGGADRGAFWRVRGAGRTIPFWRTNLATIDVVRTILGQTLQLGARQDGLSAQSPLLGSIPELDSMAVVTLIAALEEQLDIMIDDDEIDAATFATLGSLTAFCEQKQA
jgi:acyl carrier protein